MKYLILIFLLCTQPAWAVTLGSDDFDRANADPLDGTWTTISGGLGNLKIVTNVVTGTSTGARNGARFTGITTPNDAFASVAISAFTASASSKTVAVAARVSTVDESYYGCTVGGAGGFGTLYLDLVYINAGAYTSLAFTASTTVSLNDVLRIEVNGTSIKCFIQGTEILSTTHASLTSGQAGIIISTPDAVTDVSANNFLVGDFSVAGSRSGMGALVFQ